MRRVILVVGLLLALLGCGEDIPECDAEDCAYWGNCTLPEDGENPGGMYCRPGSDAECERSTYCHIAGLCAVSKNRTCIPSRAGCLASVTCKIFGLCTPRGEVECEAVATSDCKNSWVCTFYNACKPSGGICVQ